MSPTIFISAGEASGEHYGALLIDALKKQLAVTGEAAQFFGMGGERMEAAGLERVVRAEDMAVMGVTEVVLHLPRIYGEFRKLKKAIRARRPDVAVLIDFPEIHFRLAKEFHRLGVPVVFFVSPQLWAWKKHRIKLVQQYVRRMVVIFPFEEAFYRERGVSAEFVGHPLAELPLPTISREEFAAANGLDPAKTWIGLLPGSRPREIRDNLPEMLQAARRLEEGAEKGQIAGGVLEKHAAGAKAHFDSAALTARLKSCPDTKPGLSAVCKALAYQFVVPLARTLNSAQREEARKLVKDPGVGLDTRLVEDARGALWHARASVVASGTATVEAALMGNPFVVVYRVSPLTYAIAKRMVKVDHVAMVNLIAGKRIVPELIQNDFTAANIVQHLERLLPDGAVRQSMMDELAGIRGLLKGPRAVRNQRNGGAIERVAAITLEELRGASPARDAESVRS